MYTLHTLVDGLELVDATGVIVVGHFSIDGELKKEHYTKRHHNMFVIEGEEDLIKEVVGPFSFPGQTILHIATAFNPSSATGMWRKTFGHPSMFHVE